MWRWRDEEVEGGWRVEWIRDEYNGMMKLIWRLSSVARARRRSTP